MQPITIQFAVRVRKDSPAARVRFPDQARGIIMCENLARYIRDCVYLCLSDDTLKAVGPFYLVSMPGEVKDPTVCTG